MMDCFNPSAPAGGFTLLFGLVLYVGGLLTYRWLVRNKLAQLQAFEAKASELDDARRGR